MGYSSAAGMIEMTDLETALRWHLKSNHYPPLPDSLIGPCKRAIAKAQRGEWDKFVRLEGEVKHNQYGGLVPVWKIVEACHLEAFIEGED